MTTWKKWSAWVLSLTCFPPYILCIYMCDDETNVYYYIFHSTVFDLVDGINVEAIEEKIKKYSQENAEQIMINRARKVTTALLFLSWLGECAELQGFFQVLCLSFCHWSSYRLRI